MKTRGWFCRYSPWLLISYWMLSAVVLSPQRASAQLVPDTSLGNENSVVTPHVTINGSPSDASGNSSTVRIDGGAIRGTNLFHSFQDFNVGEGSSVYFSNPAAIENILTRVTGGTSSTIQGTLGVLGKANLFLINPNGIVFGSQAKLDLNGSFLATTASSIKFGSGLEFSATNPQSPPLLIVNVPVGLQFGSSPASIVNQSQATTIAPDGSEAIVGLQVQPGATLTLVGGDIALEAGVLTAPEGKIELGSVGDRSLVSLTPTAQSWTLDYQGVPSFRNISLSQEALIDTSGEGGGQIRVQGRHLILSEGSQIVSTTLGTIDGGDIDITTSESVEIIGDNRDTSIVTSTAGTGAGGNLTLTTGRLIVRNGAGIETASDGEGNAGNLTVRALESVELIGESPPESEQILPSGLFAQANSTGNGGNLSVETRRLIIRDGAFIDATTFGAGQAGNLTVNAAESIELIGKSPDPIFGGGISAGVAGAEGEERATGNSGSVTIETRRLTIQSGGQIATATRGDGDAGDLIINASESIELSGFGPGADLIRGSSGLFASAEPGSTGNVGALTINTEQLIVRDGARISADNFGPGQEGNLTVNVRQLLVQNGGTVRAGSFGFGAGGTLDVSASSSVEIIGTGTIGERRINSSLSTQAEADGTAGNLNIRTNELSVTDNGEVTVSSTGLGGAGTLDIDARIIHLDNFGSLAADSTAGLGNINLVAQDAVILRRSSRISTNSQGEDPGGNITVKTNNLVALENSDITANATNSRGGQVSINAQGLFGTQFRQQPSLESDITATSDLGAQFSGTVEISTPEVDPSSGLVNLPQTVVDVEGLVAQNLCTSQQLAGSSFVVTGRGGLPPNPNDPLANEIVVVEWARSRGVRSPVRGVRSEENNFNTSPRSQIVEAQGWKVAADGSVVLTAEAPTATPQISGLIHPSCGSSSAKKSGYQLLPGQTSPPNPLSDFGEGEKY